MTKRICLPPIQKLIKILLLILVGIPVYLKAQHNPLSESIPVLKKYDKEHLYRIAMPIGGIGTGTVSLGGSGEFRDWEIMNVPAKNYSTVTTGNDAPFFQYIQKRRMKLQRQKLF